MGLVRTVGMLFECRRYVVVLFLILTLLLAGCSFTATDSTQSPTSSATPTPTLTQTATATAPSKPTPTSTPSVEEVCPSKPATYPQNLRPQTYDIEAWDRVNSNTFENGYDATYKRSDGLKLYLEIHEWPSEQRAREVSRQYRNDTNFQVSMQYGRYTWGMQAYRENESALTLLSTGFQKDSVQLLSTVSITGEGELGMACTTRLATISPPESPKITFISSTPTPTPSTTGEGEYVVTVTDVVDGDTMEIRYQNGTTDTVRLLGVDTPEVHVENDPSEFEGIPNNKAGRDWLRDWGHKASEYVRSEIVGKEVRIVVDDQADRRGSYGRLLVYVYHDTELLNLELIEQGYARVYESSFSKQGQFSSAEETAQQNEVGVWGFSDSSTPTPSDDEENSLAVAQVHEDAEGNDHENLNDEYVVFENTGETTIDIGGWTVKDEADHTYHVPNGIEVEPGETITLYTGSGTDTDTELYWGSGSAIWNNGGDTVFVNDEKGTTVLEHSYS